MTVAPLAIRCEFTGGGFTDERVFYVALPGDETHVGVASSVYCWDNSWKPAASTTERVNGYLQVRVLRREGDESIVSLPDEHSEWLSNDALVNVPAHVTVRYP